MRHRKPVVRWGLALGLLVLLASPALAAPARYYVSLGTSLSVGIQPDANGDDQLTNKGNADQLYRSLRVKMPRLQLVKLGCPAETSGSTIDGERWGPCKAIWTTILAALRDAAGPEVPIVAMFSHETDQKHSSL